MKKEKKKYSTKFSQLMCTGKSVKKKDLEKKHKNLTTLMNRILIGPGS